MREKTMDEEATLRCSFCGKSQHEVKKLIVGPTVYICDECIELCAGIISDVQPATSGKNKWTLPPPYTRSCSKLTRRFLKNPGKQTVPGAGPKISNEITS